MQFTPQQLSGSGSYNSRVRIGNWNEDLALEEVKTKAVVASKGSNDRLIDQVVSRTWAGTKNGAKSYSPDGLLRYGYCVSLSHPTTSCTLASNLEEVIDNTMTGITQYQASGANSESLRTSFVILPANERDQGKEFVEYGDEVLFQAHSALRVCRKTGVQQKPCYLASIPSTIPCGGAASSRAQRQQVCVVSTSKGYAKGYMKWKLEQPDFTAANDNDVRINVFQPILIVHGSTGKALSMDTNQKTYSDYGPELDVFCSLEHPTTRLSMLTHEKHGVRNPNHLRTVQNSNHWVIQASQDEFEESKEGDESFAGTSIIEAMRDVRRQELGTWENIRCSLGNNHKFMSPVDFELGLISAGVPENWADQLAEEFEVSEPRSKSTLVDVQAFIDTVEAEQ